MRAIAVLIVLAALGSPAVSWAQSGADNTQPPPPEDSAEDDAGQQPRVELFDRATPGANPFVVGPLETTPRDVGFGQRPPHLTERFRRTGARPVVDRRRQVSALSDRNILAPMAQTPQKGTVSYTNYNLVGNHLTYAPSDDVAVTAGALLPAGVSDFVGTVSVKYKLHESRNMTISALPFGAYSNGTRDLDTSHAGLGAGLVADLMVTDTIVVSGGAAGFAAITYAYDEFASQCTPPDFGEVMCPTDSKVGLLPAGGHWMAATVGANWYVAETFALNVEYIHGISWGSFLGLEEDREDGETAAGRERFRDPELAAGLPHGGGPIYSLGVTWATGRSGVQLAFVMVREADNPDTFVVDESRKTRVLPMLSGGFNF